MKVQLINSPQRIGQESSGFEFLYPPLGLLYLAAYSRKVLGNQINFKFTDGLLLGTKHALEEVKRFHPDVIGISFTTSACEGAYDFISEVKKLNKEILIISGGAHSTALPEEVMLRSDTDVCVMGEGEETFTEILQGKNFSQIDGIVYRNDKSITKNRARVLIENLDQIPFPARDLIEDWSIYKGYFLSKRKPDMVMISSRGCPYDCVFCSNPVWKLNKPYFRMRSPENIVEELTELKYKYGAREVFDETDDFNLSRNHALKVSKAITEAKLSLSFKFQVRADNMDEELAESIRMMGTWLVFIGAESGNQTTLDGVNKGITLKDIETCARLLSKHGIKVYGLFMGFNVWEKDGKLCLEGVRECRRTIEFAKYLIKKGYMHFMGFSLANPFPGSKLFEIAKRHNLIDQSKGWAHWNDLWKLNMKLPGINEKDWHTVKAEAGKAQALCVLRSGRINVRALYPIFRRGLQLLKYQFSKRLF